MNPRATTSITTIRVIATMLGKLLRGNDLHFPGGLMPIAHYATNLRHTLSAYPAVVIARVNTSLRYIIKAMNTFHISQDNE